MKSSYTSPLRGCAKQQPDYPPAASIAQHPMGLLACMLDAAAGPRGTPAGHAHRSAAPTRADRLIGLMGDFGMGTRRLPQPAPSFLTQPGGPARRARHGPGRASPAPGLPRGRPRAIRGGVPASRRKVAGPATRSRSAARSTRWRAGGRGSLSESELLGAVAAQPAGELLVGVSRLDLRHVKLQAALRG